jgi:hypothetical protein
VLSSWATTACQRVIALVSLTQERRKYLDSPSCLGDGQEHHNCYTARDTACGANGVSDDRALPLPQRQARHLPRASARPVTAAPEISSRGLEAGARLERLGTAGRVPRPRPQSAGSMSLTDQAASAARREVSPFCLRSPMSALWRAEQPMRGLCLLVMRRRCAVSCAGRSTRNPGGPPARPSRHGRATSLRRDLPAGSALRWQERGQR